MENNERLIERAEAAEKSLRWLSNGFDVPNYTDDDAGRLSLCIHEYCGRGADAIRDLISALKERDG